MAGHQLPLGRLQESESIRAAAAPSPPAAKPAQDLLAAPQEPQTEAVVTAPAVVVKEPVSAAAAEEPAKEPAKEPASAPVEPAAAAPAAQQQAKPASETSSAAAESGAAQPKTKRSRGKKNKRKGKN